MRVIALLLVLGMLAEGVLLGAVCWCAWRAVPDYSADCCIVLGAHVWENGVVCSMFQYRLDAAAKAYNTGRVQKIIVSGGKGSDEPVSEAEAGKNYLVSIGIPEEDILMESASSDTRENMRFSKVIMEEAGFETALIATNDYHITRAMWIAADQGLTAYPCPAKSAVKPDTWVYNHVRETIGWCLYAFRKVTGT